MKRWLLKNKNRLISQGQVNELNCLRTYVVVLSLLMICFVFINTAREEGVYIDHAIHIMQSGNLFDPSYYRLPMFEWFIILVSKIVGVGHIQYTARIVCILATWIMAAAVFCLTTALTQDRLHAWYNVAAFYMLTLVCKLSWLSYPDPVFAMFIFFIYRCTLDSGGAKELQLIGDQSSFYFLRHVN